MSAAEAGHAPVDTLELYRWAVQDPETHAIVLRLIYERLNPGRRPIVLREDFAGTSAESVAWVALEPGRRAVAIDLDGSTLDWASARAARLLGPRAADLAFIRGDSLLIGPPEVPAADILSVLNFSVLYLTEPASLEAYLHHAQAALAPGGVLVLNVFGGPEAQRPGTTTSRITPAPRLPREAAIGPFDYHWEVRSAAEGDGTTDAPRLDCRIHFSVPTPSGVVELRDAFAYDWRLWSPVELLAACERAGFADVQMWRHTFDPAKGAAGVFLGPAALDSLSTLPTWTAYIVAQRGPQ